MSKTKPLPTPTEALFTALNRAYHYFNKALFDGELADCVLNFSRKNRAHGFFAPEHWRAVSDKKRENVIHEISLTPMTLYREPIEVFSTVVHEQCHLWQWDFGKPSRAGYHNRKWAEKMIKVGLMPSDTGKVGGKQTGQNMTHYIIEGGAYELAFHKMPKEYLLPFTSLEADLVRQLVEGGGGVGKPSAKKSKLRPKGSKKTTYTCPKCSANVWGKPNLNLRCGDCDLDFEPQA